MMERMMQKQQGQSKLDVKAKAERERRKTLAKDQDTKPNEHKAAREGRKTRYDKLIEINDFVRTVYSSSTGPRASLLLFCQNYYLFGCAQNPRIKDEKREKPPNI